MTKTKKSVLYVLVVAISAPILVFMILTSSDDGYAAMLRHMPSGVREWYCAYVLENDGFMAGESGQAVLLNVFLENRGLLPASLYRDIYNIAVTNHDDPLGVIALQVAFDSKDESLICSLGKTKKIREFFDGKLQVYRETSPKQDVLDLERIISSC